MKRQSAILLFAAILGGVASPTATAQVSSVEGTVTTSSSSPVHRARVMIMTSDGSDTLAVVFTNAQGHYSDQIATNVAVEPDPEVELYDGFVITALYPNPVPGGGNRVNVTYDVGRAEHAGSLPIIQVFDVLGRRLGATPRVAAGLYFVRLQSANDELSPARALVVSEPGGLAFTLSRSVVSGSASRESENAAPVGKTAARLAATIRVEKDGYVTEEASIDLNAGQPVERDFQLDDAALPTAAFSVSGDLEAGKPALFDASASSGANSEELTYSWAFGDALRGGGQKIAHVYKTGATFDVTLTVTGDFGACASVTQQVAINNPPPPVASNGTLTGIVSDISGFALGDVEALVVETGHTGTTNPFGQVAISGVDVGVPLTVQLTRAGYSNQIVQVGVASDTTTTLFFDTAMRPRDAAIEIDEAENGFTMRARDGVKVEIPVDGLMRGDGSMATGAVNLSMTPVDVTDPEEVRSFPGRFEGLQTDGTSALLLSLGTAEYAFDQGGEDLQLAPGKSAIIEIPVYTSDAAVGDTIPLWSMNETTGAWVREGTGTVVPSASSPSGLALSASVGHFSWWNIDKPDNDPDEAEGLCYKYECFNGICNKVKVYCWVEGAIKGDLDKRSQLDPPVFTARTFFPSEGGGVLLPGGQEVILRGTVLQENVLLQGDTTLVGQPGGATQFELVLDTVYVAEANEVTIPLDTTTTFTSGEFYVYEFQGTAGQILGFQGVILSGFGVPAIIELRDEDENVLASRGADAGIKTVQLPHDGLYRFIVTATSSNPSSIAFRVRTVSASMQVNSNVVMKIAPSDFRMLQFDPGSAEHLVIGSEAPQGRQRMRASVYDGDLNGVGSNLNDPSSLPFQPGPGRHLVVVASLPAATDSTLKIGLSTVTPDQPTMLEFDQYGEATVSTAVAYHGQTRYFEFDGTEGHGFEVGFYRTGAQHLETLRLRLYYPNGNQVPSVSIQQGWNDELIGGFSNALQATGTYRLTVGDEFYGSVGGFDIRVRKVAPSANIVVDDDLACAGAITSSVAAALLAIEDGGTVTLCDGLHASPSRPTLRKNNVTFTGESREGAVLRFVDVNRFPGSVLDATGQGLAINNMTMETARKQTGDANLGIRTTSTIEGNSAVFEDLTFRPITEDERMGYGISGQYEDVVVRNIEYLAGGGFTFGALSIVASNEALIEQSTLAGSISIRRNGNNNAVLTVDGVTLLGNAGIAMANASVGTITNNQLTGRIEVTFSDSVTIRDNNISTPEGGPLYEAITVSRTAVSVVEGNTVDRSISVSVGEGEQAVVARNRLYEGPDGQMLVVNHIHNESGGTVAVHNNIVEGMRSTQGNVRIWYAELYGGILVANNTVQAEQSGNSVDYVPTVGLSLRNQAFTGDLPVVFVNNIFVGDATTVFDVPANTTIDADYNLYSNYAHVTSDGTNRTGANDILNSNPMFTGTDFMVQAGSPAVDSGATPTEYPGIPNEDHAGAIRPQGAGYDRGAWEQ